MINFKLVKTVTYVEISPEFLTSPRKAVSKCIASKLLIYSHKINGIPLSFDIKEIGCAEASICETGDVITPVSVEYVVLVMPVGGIVNSVEGRAFGIFNTDVDGNKEYTGNFMVKEIKLKAKSFFTIVGTRP
ncbi:hypothetical protein KMI_04g07730 [Encephalitozoon hellem]|uniref:RNA polymerase III subunit RPC8 n=1 Tax=Encephalitozoon hellem TaxID=27973 RepID=A0A9Q9CBS8_ENCHE|nr:uncharacterized protein EHEL_041420 [Encephalitozoon hellem ATCC 50504]AFM98190.1 hypothetical protein EHEL_041420 [Encephalitozoon hellem ATCC 50504]KAG5859962.1 hypothetical protein KMI_04g07730 [Encephalitozoon hellem]UTX43039.1 putative RNA polymerase III subunit RPC8 [Encephalitozoon hellem]WEL38496.1 putative RNA polymerase III subunit RPC8 [Encephalitozoon hellem]|eukprot:XP_003887171.1 hypothetical protein EHEL_041420 [Encephalitozoon hellem ATCC 50504]